MVNYDTPAYVLSCLVSAVEVSTSFPLSLYSAYSTRILLLHEFNSVLHREGLIWCLSPCWTLWPGSITIHSHEVTKYREETVCQIYCKPSVPVRFCNKWYPRVLHSTGKHYLKNKAMCLHCFITCGSFWAVVFRQWDSSSLISFWGRIYDRDSVHRFRALRNSTLIWIFNALNYDQCSSLIWRHVKKAKSKLVSSLFLRGGIAHEN
jgi:hypothetical protein